MSNTSSACNSTRTHGPLRIVLPIVGLAILVVSSRAHDARAQRSEAQAKKGEDPEQKASLWMKHKLISSRDILEGMTQADYERIEKNARAMQVVGYLEGWARADLPGYKPQLRAFDRANGAIVRAAQHRNLDGVTLAYAQLMVSCVQCHSIVRDGVKR